MRVFLYIRKSTDDNIHQVQSLETQLFELRQHARKTGLSIVAEISESRTAKTPGRPEFNKMVKRIIAGEAEGILCWKLHRLARNLEDGGKLITLLQTGSIQAIHTLEKAHLPGENVIYLAFEFGIATQFSQDLSKDVRLGMQSKFRLGGWPGHAPCGYVNDREKKVILAHPIMAPLVRKSFAMFATGRHSMSAVWLEITNEGLRNQSGSKLTRSNFEDMLTNTFYYGLMRYCGELRLGIHEPLITKDLFDQVQTLIRKRHSPRRNALKPFDYRGMLRCGTCGCMITMEIQKGRTYLRCTKRVQLCPERYVREEKCQDEFEAFFESCVVEKEIPAMLAELVEEDRASVNEAAQLHLNKLRNELSATSEQVDQLLSLLLRGLINENDYILRKNILTENTATLKETIRLAEVEPDRFEPLDTLIRELNEAIKLNSENTYSKKRDFIKKIGSNLFLRGRALDVKLENRWQILMDWKRDLPTLWSKMSPDRKLVELCTLRDRVRLQSEAPPDKK